MADVNEDSYEIRGRVVDAAGRGIARLRVEAWDKDLLFDDLVGGAETGPDGAFRIVFGSGHFRELFFDHSPDLYFKVFADKRLVANTKDSVLWNVGAGARLVEIVVTGMKHNDHDHDHDHDDPPTPPGPSVPPPTDDDRYTVAGRVTTADRPGVGGLHVEIVDKNVGGDVKLAEATTDDRGRYEARFSGAELRQRGKAHPDLQARVLAGRTFLGASAVLYDAGHNVTLSVALTAADGALPSEWETLTHTLATIYRGWLGDLQESDARQDITYLANKTGWDARAIALAALAEQFGRDTPIPAALFYALFRAGLPANADRLYRTARGSVEAIWKQAIEQGIVPTALARELDASARAYEQRAAQTVLTVPAVAGASVLGDMLAVSGVDAARDQQRFAELYTAHHDDLDTFWKQVGATLGEERATRLQLDGRLAFLTLNNAPLMRALHASQANAPLTDTVQLAQAGWYRVDQWRALLDRDGVPVPEGLPGDAAAQKQGYAELLAAQVRLSHPTASIAAMVRNGDLALDAREGVHAFLDAHDDFEIFAMPVEQYVKRNALEVPAETITQVKRLQRVYQITPSDEAMAGLLQAGVDAAGQVVRYDRDQFVTQYGKAVGGDAVAAQIHDRAVQVHNAVLNIATSYIVARNGIPLGAAALSVESEAGGIMQPAPQPPAPAVAGGVVDAGDMPMIAAAANAGDILAYATMEELFGEMDYCACDHCRSVLSPAAYLVDLLHFIDRAPTEAGKLNPQAVLFQRRPDIKHLPLTCDNTNVALPYIDLVNETLEYFVANTVQPLSLDGYIGHDTDGVSSADLLAQPQYVIDAAYTTLRNERFPTPLPFHEPLERLRRYFDKFEVPLPLAMERLRTTDALERGTATYGWRDILLEELKLSRAEYEILADSAAVPLARMFGFANGTTDAVIIAALSNARDFSRRLGLTYEEVASLLTMRFVNPNADLLPKLERLSVPFAALAALKGGTLTAAAFLALLPTGATAPDPAEYGGDIVAWVMQQANYDRIMGIITLSDPSGAADPCSFASLEFRFATPLAAINDTATRLRAVEFVRMLRFIRLWKKLGWSMEQTDAAICALFPVPPFGSATVDTIAKIDAGFVTLLPRLGVVQRLLRTLSLTTKRDLLPLLALWTPLEFRATSGLYRAMFTAPSLPARDPAFADDGYGEVLQNATERLVGHTETLRAAFGLTGDEVAQALQALGFATDHVDVAYVHGAPALETAIRDTDAQLGYTNATGRLSYTGFLSPAKRDALKAVAGVTATFQAAIDALFAANQAALTPLTLATVSAVYRRGWLARKLKISVREMLLLTRLTGLDPFAVPDPTNAAVLRLVDLVQAMKARSLKSAAALYLVWNQDLSGKSAPSADAIATLARTLRADCAAIEDQFAATEDPGGDVARARMTLVYGTESTTAFFELLDGTIVVDVPYTQAAATLPAAVLAAAPKLAYDPFRHRLSHTGLLSAALGATVNGLAGMTAAFQAAVTALVTRSDDALGSYFARTPELRPLYNAYIGSLAPVEEKRRTLLASFRPELSRRRKRQQAAQRFSVESKLDLAATRTLLDPASAPYPLHADGDVTRPALDDVLALETPGLAAEFYFRSTATGVVNGRVTADATIDYAPATAHVLPPNPVVGDPVSAVWTGRLEAAESGYHNLIVETDVGATVTLSLGGAARGLTQHATVWRNTNPIELAAGTLYEIRIVVENVRNVVAVRWETPKRPREVIPSRYLYPPSVFAPFAAVYVRLLKVAALMQTLRLTAGEMAHFAIDADERINGDGWLNALPVVGDATAAVAASLFIRLRNLLDFARIKNEVSPDDERLLDVLRDPAAADTNGALVALTQWQPRSLHDLLAHLGEAIGDLSHFARFGRAYDAMALAGAMGVSTGPLIRATTNEPTAATVRAFDSALRARYDASDWRSVVQPINDTLRGMQRDALVAYILHRMRADPASAHIDTPDKLFEYFLTDVQMEPCMQTSRVRHALSSVQLFVERCLMKLEPRVAPSSLSASQWEWMKRYRVWEANRKVFLYPENWLEPELRDDKSPFFKEIESELLQADITDDSAATAVLHYLAKLEEVAMLEPCGIHHVIGDPARTTDDVEHVVARTAGAHRKYFYRRREYGYWTPWEQIKLDIEGDPVVPVVWKGRLLLFWLRITKQTPLDPDGVATTPTTDTGTLANKTLGQLQGASKSNGKKNARIQVGAVLCYSEYYNGKWQPTKTSDVERPTSLGDYDTFDAFDRSLLKLETNEEGPERYLRITIGGDAYSTFVLYSTHSLVAREEDDSHLVADMFIGPRYLDVHAGPFKAEYYDFSNGHTLKRTVLSSTLRDSVLETTHPMSDAMFWKAPFFYRDQRHVFYVTTETEPALARQRSNYGFLAVDVVHVATKIPSLVYGVALFEPKPRLWGDGDPVNPDIGIANTNPVKRFIAGNAYIDKAIGASGVVPYHGRDLGPAGAMPAGGQAIHR